MTSIIFTHCISSSQWDVPCKNIFCVFVCLWKHYDGKLLPYFPSILEHHAVWLKHLFKSQNKSDAPIHWRIQVMQFYSWGDPANLQNWKAQNQEKQRMTVQLYWCLWLSTNYTDVYHAKYPQQLHQAFTADQRLLVKTNVKNKMAAKMFICNCGYLGLIKAFWDVTIRSPVNSYWYFTMAYWLYLQGLALP
jgi:hypothetical protein